MAAGSARGESGVSISRMRFQGGAHFSATAQQHLVWFVSPATLECRIGSSSLRHVTVPGSIAVVPAELDSGADAKGSIETLLVTIDPAKLALAAAEDQAFEARPMERLSGNDEELFELARTMAAESAGGYPNGALFWNETSARFIDGLLLRHSSSPPPRTRGALHRDVMKRMRDYVADHLDQPISVDILAQMAGRSRFHFSRIFARSVGVSPYRYIVHLRLKRAMEHLRDREMSLAEIAACTGFADQSHLSRWVRRVYGVSPSQVN